MQSRSAISMTFTWIFVVIAGVGLITLFYSIAQQQIESAQEEVASNAITQINYALRTQAGTDKPATFRIGKNTLTFTCMQEGDFFQSNLRVGPFDRRTDSLLIASNGSLTGKEIAIVELPLHTPFYAGNVVLVGQREQGFMLTATPGYPLQEQVAGNFSEQIPDVFGSTGTYVAQATPGIPIDPDVWTIDPDSSEPRNFARSGVLHYQNKQYEYVGEAMLFGYLFSENTQRIDCFEHKLTQTISRQAKIESERAKRLTAAYTGTNCQTRYGTSEIDSLITNPLDNLRGKTQAVQAQNEALLRGDRCATIY